MMLLHSSMRHPYMPFPYPYVVGTELVLLIHAAYAACQVAIWSSGPAGAAGWTFVMVLLMRFMNGMNAELDKPMSGGLLHIDTDEQQHDLVQRLMMLLQSSVAATASLDDSAVTEHQALLLLIPAIER